jgi:hypothetical protein
VVVVDRSRISTTLLAGCLTVAASSPALAAEPSSDQALPRYDDPVFTPIDPPKPQVPNDGRGLLAAGGIVGIGGTVSLISGIVLITTGDSSTQSDFWPLLVVGAVGTTAGSLLLGWGVPRHREYRKWEAQQTDAIPRQGLGLMGAGTALMVGGMAGTLISASIWSAQNDPLKIYLDPNPRRLAGAKVGVGLGATSIALGAALLATGAVGLKRFGAWRRARSVHLTPTLMPTRHALHVGLVGHF